MSAGQEKKSTLHPSSKEHDQMEVHVSGLHNKDGELMRTW